jgi:eukaryotic-like serine/threonine-protein kinase
MPTEIGSRYAVQEKLGQGGMAVVYRVRDRVTGQELALKQLVYQDENARQKLMLPFEREFQTLTSLAHPRIVKVFEYGLHEQTPYYTMELLAGEDLSRVAPFDWRIACSLLRDVASALAMVHSRRLLHRDVSTHNVKRMADGRAKLIDFGALTPMGIAMTVIGTPPFVSPEALNRQSLDGRADLFSLGALLYWLLTGRHAFPARRMEDLPDCWHCAPEAPSALVNDVPASLSALTLSLLSVDVLGRPTTAWEVIDRLSAIAELPADQEHGTARAYLLTPTLVGREHELMQARE